VSDHRSGVVAILGLPNAGKSTLLNRWVGERLAIVTPKPQTTRSRILGILSQPGAQALLLDTPGLVRGGRGALDEPMRKAVAGAAQDADVALLLVDLGRGWRDTHAELVELVGKTPLVAVGTQLDRNRDAAWPPPELAGRPSFRISARTGEGCDALLADVLARLPEGPPFYPEDQLTDRPMRFLAAELVRESAFRGLGDELPYGVAVEVLEYDESRPGLVRIRANLIVARESHKGMVVGAGGSKIKEIGTRAREAIQELVGEKVHLELWVKVEPGWMKQRKRLKAFGYV